MGYMSSVPQGVTHLFKNLTLGKVKFGHWTAGDKNNKGVPEYKKTWTNGAINAYHDGDDPTYISASQFRTKPDGTQYTGSPDVLRLTNDTGSVVKMTLTNGDSSVSSYQSMMSIVGIAYNDGTTLNERYWFNRLDTRQTISFNVPDGATVYWGRMGNHFSAYYSYMIESTNHAPTIPGPFLVQPNKDDIYICGEELKVEWGSSTDEDGDSFTYALEFYNGVSWSVLATNLKELAYTYTLENANTVDAQFRVKAVDSNNGASEYRLTNTFTVRKQLLLVQDEMDIKTFKNGSWETI